MSPSAFSILGPGGVGGRGSNLKQNLTPTGGDVCGNIKIGAGVWIRPPHTNRETDKQTNICEPIFIYIEDR